MCSGAAIAAAMAAATASATLLARPCSEKRGSRDVYSWTVPDARQRSEWRQESIDNTTACTDTMAPEETGPPAPACRLDGLVAGLALAAFRGSNN